MRTRLAAEFDRSGFDYDAPTVSDIVNAIEQAGAVEPEKLARHFTGTYLTRNGTDRQEMADLIGRALGGSVPKAETGSANISIRGGDTTYNVQLRDSASVGSLNIGPGKQVVVDAGSARDNVLAGIAALVQAGLRETWDGNAAQALAETITQRGDITTADVQRIAAETIRREQPTQSRARAFLEKVAVSGLGGALGTGLAAGGGEILHLLPH